MLYALLTLSQSIHKGAKCVAIKRLADPLDFSQARRAAAQASADWHAHVVPLLFSYTYLTEHCLVFPLAKSNLEEYWENNKLYLVGNRTTMDYPLVLWVAQQCEGLADALLHLHDLCLTSAEDQINLLAADSDTIQERDSVVGTHHGNIKPTNILAFFRPGRQFPILQLMDFGCTKQTRRHNHEKLPRTKDHGTGDYVAPEVFFSRPVSTKSDIWSLGCIFLDFVEWLTPIHSLESVPRRILTDDDQTQLYVQGREAWRDWRRSPVPNGPMDVAAFYFDPSSGELSEWIDTVRYSIWPPPGACPSFSPVLTSFLDSTLMMPNMRIPSVRPGWPISWSSWKTTCCRVWPRRGNRAGL